MPSPGPSHYPSLLEVVDALILFDTPLLDQRFQDTIAMHRDPVIRAALAELPRQVAHGSRLTRRAAVQWLQATGSESLAPAFKDRAERYLLDAFLQGAEAQIRLKTFLVKHAPNAEVRKLMEDAIEIHRGLAVTLRRALQRVEAPLNDDEVAAPLVEAGAPPDELRARLEAAILGANALGRRAREVVVSVGALAQLRAQGLFHDGEHTVLGVPVQVDLGWGGAAFAVLTMDSLTLAELPPQE